MSYFVVSLSFRGNNIIELYSCNLYCICSCILTSENESMHNANVSVIYKEKPSKTQHIKLYVKHKT